jgi:hypothetical protein
MYRWQNLPPVLLILVANLAGGKFAASDVDTVSLRIKVCNIK